MKIFDWLRRLGTRETEWRDEIDSHLAMRAEWNRARGLPQEHAHNAARKQFGSPLYTLEEVRAVHIRRLLDELRQDVRYAARGFSRSPGFALVVVATIAIGIGASTAVFGVIDPLLFRHLPYPNDDRLVSLGFFGPVDSNEFNVVSSYLDWKHQQKPFASLTSMRAGGQCDWLAAATPLRVGCYAVEANFLATFGITPIAGRDFNAADDRPGAPTVVLLSYGFWQRAFGGDPRAVGRTAHLDNHDVRIVGVLPKSFEMPQLGEFDLLMPERLEPGRPRAQNAGSFLRTFARLRDGVTMEWARAEMLPLFTESVRLDVPAELRSEVRLVVRSLRDRQIHEVKLASWLLLGTVLALLLVACGNVANLLLARAATRRRELAMRAAIGAARGRLIRQTLTESLLLGMAGGAAGCGVAWALLAGFRRAAVTGMPRFEQAHVDLRVLLFALAASVAAALLFGIVPALERPRAVALVAWSAAGPARTLFRKVLVSAQVALSLILLAGASLLLRSLWNLDNQPLGFQPEHLTTASLTLNQQRYPSAAARTAFFNQLEERLQHIPGAGSFAISDSIPPRGRSMGRPYSNIRVEGYPPVAGNGGMVTFRWVTPGYFQTMRIPIVSGRAFLDEERASGESPVILSASLAHRMFGKQNPVGQHLGLDGVDGRWCPIVGVAADVKNMGLGEPSAPEYYRLRMRNAAPPPRDAVALFRTALDRATLERWIRRECRSLDPAMPVTVDTMDKHVDTLLSRPRFVASLVTVFAALGLLLASVGLYGVLSFLIAQQTREIGVRMALGARPSDVALAVGKHAGVWTGIGLLAGLAGSFLLTRTMRGLLFEVSPNDPLSLGAAMAVLALVAALAALVPSWRAARVDPAIALRHE
jgi:putative ABC transport system permease protein